MPSSSSSSPQQAAQLLILLNIAVVFMGTALTIRDLVGERAIFRREQAVGLSASVQESAGFASGPDGLHPQPVRVSPRIASRTAISRGILIRSA